MCLWDNREYCFTLNLFWYNLKNSKTHGVLWLYMSPSFLLPYLCTLEHNRALVWRQVLLVTLAVRAARRFWVTTNKWMDTLSRVQERPRLATMRRCPLVTPADPTLALCGWDCFCVHDGVSLHLCRCVWACTAAADRLDGHTIESHSSGWPGILHLSVPDWSIWEANLLIFKTNRFAQNHSGVTPAFNCK